MCKPLCPECNAPVRLGTNGCVTCRNCGELTYSVTDIAKINDAAKLESIVKLLTASYELMGNVMNNLEEIVEHGNVSIRVPDCMKEDNDEISNKHEHYRTEGDSTGL